MKKKSSKKQKVNVYQAANGYQMPPNPYDPWQMNNMNFQMPTAPQFQPMGQTTDYSPYPQDEMRVIPTGNVAYDVKEQNNKKGSKFGKTAQQIGQKAGQFMSDAISVGIPALNALIPEQQDNRQKFQPIAYNPYSMGTGSQAIYEDGGQLPNGNQYSPIMQNTSIKRRKKGNITITEEVPNNMPNLLPEVTIYGNRPKVATPAPEPYISFDKLHTPAYPNSWSYLPTPHNMSETEFFKQVQNTPNYIDGYQVEKSPDFIREAFTGQYPNWEAVHDFTNTNYPQFENGGSLSPEKAKQILKDGKVYGKPLSAKQERFFGALAGGNSNKADMGELITYEDGGDIQPIEAKSGIHINPKNKGKFNALKKRTGKTTEELTHSKNPLTRKRAIFAQNAAKWKHENGGYISGQELDLSPDEIQYLQNQGYDIEFL